MTLYPVKYQISETLGPMYDCEQKWFNIGTKSITKRNYCFYWASTCINIMVNQEVIIFTQKLNLDKTG